MQIYKDMDIGTAKVTKEEMQGIKHYLVDCVSPEKRYTVSDFKRDSEKAIEEILAKGKTPIIVGGTGLYANSLIYGIEYQDMEFDLEYRDELMKKADTENGLAKLYEEAKEIDSEAMKNISKNDKKRITRVLEIYKATRKK
jgi:tRNA dimethylallyltransferase